MTTINFKQLIDMAIGTPEPGHVNFYALHCVLCSFAEKLNIIGKTVDCSKFGNVSIILNSGRTPSEMCIYKKFGGVTKSRKKRLAGGTEMQDDEENAAPAEEAAPTEAAPTEAAPAPEAAAAEGDAPPEAPPEDAPPAEDGPPPDAPPADDVVAVKSEPALEAVPEGEDAKEEADVPPAEPPGDAPPADATETEYEAPNDYYTTDDYTGAATSEQITDMVSLAKGVAVMKDQLELAVEQLLKLTTVTINRTSSPQAMYDQLRALADKLRAIQKSNIYIGGTLRLHEEVSYSMREEFDQFDDIDDYIDANIEIHSQESLKQPQEEHRQTATGNEYELDLHLCYTPEKMLDQLMQMKSEMCLLTNKVNEISATILEQDCQRTTMILQDLQDGMREVKFNTSALKDAQERMEIRQNRTTESIEEILKTLAELENDKIDRSEISVLLADKVDYTQLQRKVSHEQMQEMQCRLEKQLCEMHRLIALGEKNMMQVVENIRSTIGLDTIDEILKKFKDKIELEVHKLQDTLQKYLDSTNDECAAAGARVKVLTDLACVSCDTTCVMRSLEKAKVAKLPSAHASAIMSPLVTYELGSLRKSGTMGYHRKDEFPHAPHAWMQRQTVNIKACVPRHAGGAHTTYTAKEHVEKVLLTKK